MHDPACNCCMTHHNISLHMYISYPPQLTVYMQCADIPNEINFPLPSVTAIKTVETNTITTTLISECKGQIKVCAPCGIRARRWVWRLQYTQFSDVIKSPDVKICEHFYFESKVLMWYLHLLNLSCKAIISRGTTARLSATHIFNWIMLRVKFGLTSYVAVLFTSKTPSYNNGNDPPTCIPCLEISHEKHDSIHATNNGLMFWY